MSLASENALRFSDLLAKLVSAGPFADRDDAERALVTTLETLSCVLPLRLVDLLEAALPPECGAPLTRGRQTSQSTPAPEPGPLPGGSALERVAEVCATLTRVLPADLVQDIIRALPEELRAVFEPSSLHAMRSLPRKFNPHADIKLSSARGLTQEREHETLAEGRPPTERK